MCSSDLVAKLKRNNYVVNRIKPDNEQIYYIIDAINDAINAGKQISFQYYDYTGLKKKVLKNKGEIYKLSPCRPQRAGRSNVFSAGKAAFRKKRA